MAIKVSTQYPGKTDAPTASYPGGAFKNVSAPGAGDGTPFEEAWPNDLQGFLQMLLKQSTTVASGTPDTALTSQYWQAILDLFAGFPMYTDSGAADTVELASNSGKDPLAYYDGMVVTFKVNTLNTGAATLKIAALAAKSLTTETGGALVAAQLVAGKYVTAQFNSAADRFEIVVNTADYTASLDAAYQRFMVYDDTGSANDYEIDAVSGLNAPSYFDGLIVDFVAANVNTGASTVEIGALGAKALVDAGSNALVGGEVRTTRYNRAVYRSGPDEFQLMVEPDSFKIHETPTQTITAGGSLILAHGLPSLPREISVIVKCTTAEFGYSIGDELAMDVGAGIGAAGGVMGHSIVPDAVNLNIRFSTGGSTVYASINKSTGAHVNLTDANWDVIFIAKAKY